MKDLVFFILTFLFILVIYELFIVKEVKGKRQSSKEKKYPREVSYLIHKYKLDVEKVNYKRLLQVVAFTSSFDIALTVMLIFKIPSFVLAIIGGFIGMLVIIIVSYHIVYLFYKKKGMIKNES